MPARLVGRLGDVAEWLRSGLQSRPHRFDSGRRLLKALQIGILLVRGCADSRLLAQKSPKKPSTRLDFCGHLQGICQGIALMIPAPSQKSHWRVPCDAKGDVSRTSRVASLGIRCGSEADAVETPACTERALAWDWVRSPFGGVRPPLCNAGRENHAWLSALSVVNSTARNKKRRESRAQDGRDTTLVLSGE